MLERAGRRGVRSQGHAGHVGEVGRRRRRGRRRRAGAQADHGAAEHHVVQRPERRARARTTRRWRASADPASTVDSGAASRPAGRCGPAWGCRPARRPGPQRLDEPLDRVEQAPGLDDGRQSEGGVAHVGGRLGGGRRALGSTGPGARAGGGEPAVGPGASTSLTFMCTAIEPPPASRSAGSSAGSTLPMARSVAARPVRRRRLGRRRRRRRWPGPWRSSPGRAPARAAGTSPAIGRTRRAPRRRGGCGRPRRPPGERAGSSESPRHRRHRLGPAVAHELQQLAAHRAGLRVVAEQADQAGRRAGDRADPVDRVAALEDEQRARASSAPGSPRTDRRRARAATWS